LFVEKLQKHSQFEEHLSFLRKVFFMEAGHKMSLFSQQIFSELDKGNYIKNLYMLNGMLSSCLKENEDDHRSD